MPKNVRRAEIVGREDITDELFKLWLYLAPEDRFLFMPGQYCTIGMDPDSKLWRAYSIASAPHEDLIELFVELVPPPHGNLTPLLWKLEAGIGDSVFIFPRAKGVFTLQDAKNHVFVSTVTGVVPYISMLRDYQHHQLRDRRFFVLHGASYQDELVYDDELRSMMGDLTLNLSCIFTVSRPDESRNVGWHEESGRVNTLVEKYLDSWALEQSDTVIYVCGHPEMIEDVKKRLAPNGWQVVEERFWKQDE